MADKKWSEKAERAAEKRGEVRRPVSAADEGLDAALQRALDVPEIGEWMLVTPRWVVEAVARAAREDVPAITQQARADAWDEGVATALNHAVRDDDGITLTLDKPNPYRDESLTLPGRCITASSIASLRRSNPTPALLRAIAEVDAEHRSTCTVPGCTEREEPTMADRTSAETETPQSTPQTDAREQKWAEARVPMESTPEYIRRLVRERDEARAAIAHVEAFINQRPEFIKALMGTSGGDDQTDYHRWQGHAEARRHLATRLGVPAPHHPGETVALAATDSDGGES